MMLKKLILTGFKSFADRTEFEFDRGVSCVVGPNGCGKSNVVDAFKWVLGEQSARSLRGMEMADVIFNGSAARRPGGLAEVTLVFEDDGRPPREGQEPGGPPAAPPGSPKSDGVISISRRLFRSGHSEYLINNVPCRLRDIREMFMDTGIGADSYSLIEQGRIEQFLQASQEDRRAIFDEAAGISKYKARRKEALRKLERVEQDLLRLRDILQEVERRLRSIKHQAAKARSYQTYSQRLKELRCLHFLAQYHDLSEGRRQLKGRLDAATDALAAISARIDQLEAAQSATELEAVDLERTARDLQNRLAALGGQITAAQERTDMLAARCRELDEQILSALARCEDLEAKVEAAGADRARRQEHLAALQREQSDLTAACRAARDRHAAGELAIAQLQAELEDEKAGTIDLFRRTAQLHNEIRGLEVRHESLHGQQARLAGRAEEITQALAAALTERAEVQAKLADVQAVLGESAARLEETRRSAQRAHEGQQQARDELAQARERRSALVSRIQALREMQDRLEGVGAGERRILAAKQAGKVHSIRGLLGEFIRTDLEHAALVEAALAGADQYLLAEHADRLAAEAGALRDLLGENASAEIVCLDSLTPLRQDFDLAACPQAIGRAIDHVQFEPALGPLMWRLLGSTVVVRTLADAFAAAAAAPDGLRFVTLDGTVLEADRRVRLGAARRAAGVIARRSELAELQARQGPLDEEIERLELRCRSAGDEVRHLDEIQQGLRTAIYEANTERVECQGRLARTDERIAALRREQPLVSGDLDHLAGEIESTVRARHEAAQKAEQLDKINRQRQEHVEELQRRIAGASAEQQALAERLTEAKVALAAVDEKCRAAREALEDLARQADQMQRDLAAQRQQIELNRQRKTDAEEGIGKARQEVERLYAEQLRVGREAQDVEESRRGLHQKLEDIRCQLVERRKAHAEAADQVNALKLQLGETDVRIETLIARASDEMGMDLLGQFQAYSHDAGRDWAAVEAEIDDLRRKIERLGNVNLDAIVEQDELEQRREFLSRQTTDIETSRDQLQDLIRRINKESRELFLKTFGAVREHFQELFRKLFGGGKADILLLNPEDVLESPIEIVARPPGKELRTLSLLSGGEKTMIALSLLFSFFKCRPSPVCLLDEVDAALDETNTERFTRLVGEFVPSSQFIIISHAKRTISMANVLYGVTMQEPGVSKRISVRFEDAGKYLDRKGAPLQPVEA